VRQRRIAKPRGPNGLGEKVELFAGLEAYGFAWGNCDFRSGAGVAPDAGFAGFDGEDTEAAKLNAIACDEGLLHAVEDCVNGRFCLCSWQTGAFNNPLYKILLNHFGSPSLGCNLLIFVLKCLKDKNLGQCADGRNSKRDCQRKNAAVR
jgi:hypothetical protein